MSETPPPAMYTVATSIAAPPRTVRRRDGITLAATGAIPDRVRAQILAEHRTHLTGRVRAGVRSRLDAGLLPLPIPYGYRRMNTLRATPDTTAGHLATPHPLTASLEPAQISTMRGCRCGRAPAQHWLIDRDCADTLQFMARCIRYGMTPARLATHLNTDPDTPPLLTPTGRARPWTGRVVVTLLTDPVLTGHSVWGRTHHGRPRPRHQWMLSRTLTHPSILDTASATAMTNILTGKPNTEPRTRPAQVCPTRPRWRR